MDTVSADNLTLVAAAKQVVILVNQMDLLVNATELIRNLLPADPVLANLDLAVSEIQKRLNDAHVIYNERLVEALEVAERQLDILMRDSSISKVVIRDQYINLFLTDETVEPFTVIARCYHLADKGNRLRSARVGEISLWIKGQHWDRQFVTLAIDASGRIVEIVYPLLQVGR